MEPDPSECSLEDPWLQLRPWAIGSVVVAGTMVLMALVACPRARMPDRPDLPSGVLIREVDHGGRVFRVVSVARGVDLDLYGQGKDGSGVHRFSELDEWLREKGRRLVAATNAGIFEEGPFPLGLTIERGELVRPINLDDGDGNFYLKPNGVFWVDAAGAHVGDAASWPGEVAGVRLATQSGPLVLSDGMLHPSLREDSPNVVLRSGVCVDAEGTVHLVWSEATRFWELATLFRDVLGCDDGLYLDGVISQMVDPTRPPDPATDGVFGGILAVTVPDASG